jgi:allantoinase
LPFKCNLQRYAATFDRKLAASYGKLHVDVAFWGGLVPGNAHNESVLNELIGRGVVGLKTFMSPSGIGDFPNTARVDLEAALKVLAKHQLPLMAHAELVGDVEDLDPEADPRKHATYLATRPRKWEQVRKAGRGERFLFLIFFKSERERRSSALARRDF